MNRVDRPLGPALLGLVLTLALIAFGGSSAQDQDAYLDRYDLAIGNLQRAVAALPDDPAQAREEIDLAFNALLTLSRDAASGPLAGALGRVFERARTAITNVSRHDLAVQAAVLEGGFQRLVYDAAIRAANEGDLALARARLTHLARDLGVPEGDRAALADTERSASALRYDLEAGVAAVVAERVAAARAEGEPGAAYQSLAGAYGAFLLVQDSPRAAAGLNAAFVEAATALVEERAADVVTTLEAIEADIAALREAALERRASVPTGATTALAEPTELPALEAPAAVEPAPEAEEAAVAEGPPVADAVLDAEALDGIDLAALWAQFEEEARRGRLDVLETDLAAVGVPAQLRPAQAAALESAGFGRFHMAVDAFAAELAAAIAAAHRGDAADLEAALARARTTYVEHVSPAMRPANTSVDVETLELFTHLQGLAVVRIQDLVVLSGQAEAVRHALAGRATSAIQATARDATVLWAGLARSAALLTIGLLALVPLFLLNLAFGGGNRNWQLIGVALFLLLVPALYEGLVALGGLLVDVVPLELLSVLPAFSMFNSTVAQVAWTATTLLALLFAIGGLYGICVQFGLLGRRRGATPGTASTRTTRTATTTQSVDWDEEV